MNAISLSPPAHEHMLHLLNAEIDDRESGEAISSFFLASCRVFEKLWLRQHEPMLDAELYWMRAVVACEIENVEWDVLFSDDRKQQEMWFVSRLAPAYALAVELGMEDVR